MRLYHCFLNVLRVVTLTHVLVSVSVTAQGQEPIDKGGLFPPISDSLSLSAPVTSQPGVTLITNGNGQFTMRRASDGKWLLYPNPGTTYLSVSVDGNIATNLGGGGLIVANQSGNTWVYSPVYGVQFTQILTVEGNAVRCAVEAAHVSGNAHFVQVRYLFDTQVDDNDGAPLYAGAPLYSHHTYEVQFAPPPFAEWRSWRRPEDQSVIGVGTLDVNSDNTKIVFCPLATGVRQHLVIHSQSK